jgi:signal peptide peptidase SppA
MNDNFNPADGTPWALLPQWVGAMDIAAAHAAGPYGAKREANRTPAEQLFGVAVVPMTGVMTQRQALRGGFSTDEMRAYLNAIVENPDVRHIVLDLDSPGGSAYGVAELADEIISIRKLVPVTAVINSLAGSGAYWIASSAGEIVITPGGEAGGIGITFVHSDYSAALKAKGVATTVIAAGKNKTEGHPSFPLSPSARSFFQARAQTQYDAFVKAIARGRNDSIANVRAGYGEGRLLGASAAVAANLADRVGTLDQVVAEIKGGKAKHRLAGTERALRALSGLNRIAQAPRLASAERRLALTK